MDNEGLQRIIEIISAKALSDFQKSDQINFRQDGFVNIEKENVERRALLEYAKRIIEEEVREIYQK
jgi:argonaute-like protein implicated in RNA metabolism and viral defense